VYPSPRSTETPANGQNPHPNRAIATYKSVVPNSVARHRSSDTRRPSVSATTPVGISNSTFPSVNAALVIMTWKMSSPACSLNSVSMPQMSDIARLNSPVMRR